MPREASEHMLPGEDLLSICLAMHMHHTGASDPLPSETLVRYHKILRLAIQHWHVPIHSPWFDGCVRNLILATMGEAEKSLPPRGERVLVTRKMGDKHIARREIKPNAIFRNPQELHWMNDQDKFMDIAMNPVIEWEPLPTASPVPSGPSQSSP